MHQKFDRLFHLDVSTSGQRSWIIRDEYVGFHLDLLQELSIGISQANLRNAKQKCRIDLPFPPNLCSRARNWHSDKLADI